MKQEGRGPESEDKFVISVGEGESNFEYGHKGGSLTCQDVPTEDVRRWKAQPAAKDVEVQFRRSGLDE